MLQSAVGFQGFCKCHGSSRTHASSCNMYDDTRVRLRIWVFAHVCMYAVYAVYVCMHVCMYACMYLKCILACLPRCCRECRGQTHVCIMRLRMYVPKADPGHPKLQSTVWHVTNERPAPWACFGHSAKEMSVTHFSLKRTLT
jgi:hypothetical protein